MTEFEMIENEIVSFFNKRGMGKLTATHFLKHYADDPQSYLTILHAFYTAIMANNARILIENHRLGELSRDHLKAVRDSIDETLSKMDPPN